MEKQEELSTYTKADFEQGDYVIHGMRGITFNQAMRIWKTKWSLEKCLVEIIKNPIQNPLRDMIIDRWDNAQPLTREDIKKEWPSPVKHDNAFTPTTSVTDAECMEDYLKDVLK